MRIRHHSQAHRAFKETQDPQARLELTQLLQDPLAPLAPQVLLDPQELLVLLPDLQARQVHKEILVLLAHKVYRAFKGM